MKIPSLIVLLTSCFIYDLLGQSLSERIEAAGVVYVKKIPQKRFFVEIKRIHYGVPDWSSVENIETSIGDTIQISSVGMDQGAQGDLLHFKDVDIDLVNLINNKVIGFFKDVLPESVQFLDDIESKGDTYFILDITINDFNEIIVQWELNINELQDYLQFKVSLNEMTTEYKRPKKVTSLFKNGKVCKVDLTDIADRMAMEEAVTNLSKMLMDKTRIDLDDLGQQSKKKLTKAMSK